MMSVQYADPLMMKQSNATMLVCEEFVDKINPLWFQPSFWGKDALPIMAGGRGMAWFIARPEGDWVLRLYGRGGLVVHITKRAHLFLNQYFVRAFRELRLLTKLHQAGLNVPRPIAAAYRKVAYGWYHAEIIIERVPHAKSFAQLLGSSNGKLWFEVGRLIRQFHDYGVYHADLNCHNILISESGVYLIDFDKGRFRRGQSWKKSNLQRLRHSIEKLSNTDLNHSPRLRSLWQMLLSGYDAGESGVSQ
ncbi:MULTISPECIES: 3-deoxy-D-manno-octulosonic acid kinase [unclassified Legionella]|uniref:3-deoxy-D-manno-octulosonic acid kinase n=1 Tax=unclassified Legionella TaxID=2622702 RepID=UPI001E50CC6A|nr:3-deoxy-D-manno-octulosonic acid kinase [Legionella sp. 31fI33]MCC5014441.1 3-deoxy-D-manno-octulosonic acid kinase [Legionella sp. 31fI33]